LEQRGVPVVALVTAQFAAVARASATARGMPDLPIVVFPAELEEQDPAAVVTACRERWPEIRAGLVR
jgi:hypothetical protein